MFNDPYCTKRVMLNFINEYCLKPSPTMPEQVLAVQDILVANNLKVAHFFNRDDIKAGGVTVVYSTENTNRNCKMVEVAVAYCSVKDTFSRKQGTSLALDRFMEGQTISVPARSQCSDFTILPTLKAMLYDPLFLTL